jgi:hypothetical protein
MDAAFFFASPIRIRTRDECQGIAIAIGIRPPGLLQSREFTHRFVPIFKAQKINNSRVIPNRDTRRYMDQI